MNYLFQEDIRLFPDKKIPSFYFCTSGMKFEILRDFFIQEAGINPRFFVLNTSIFSPKTKKVKESQYTRLMSIFIFMCKIFQVKWEVIKFEMGVNIHHDFRESFIRFYMKMRKDGFSKDEKKVALMMSERLLKYDAYLRLSLDKIKTG